MLSRFEPELTEAIASKLDVMSLVRLASAYKAARTILRKSVSAHPELLTKRVAVQLMQQLREYFTIRQPAPYAIYTHTTTKWAFQWYVPFVRPHLLPHERDVPKRVAYLFEHPGTDPLVKIRFYTNAAHLKIDVPKCVRNNRLQDTTLNHLRITPTSETAGGVLDTFNGAMWAYDNGVMNSLLARRCL
jgi:hypothetical protein